MKLSMRQSEQTATQIGAQIIPANHPLVPQLTELYGEHTFFIDAVGLGILEADAAEEGGGEEGRATIAHVVMLADWADPKRTQLSAHDPEPTEVVVELEPDEANGQG